MIKKATDFEKIREIRISVFQDGIGLSENDIFDADDTFLEQFVILDGQKIIGTFRLRSVDNSYKIERMGILHEYRSKGFGKASLIVIKSLAKKSNKKQIILDSIYDVKDFYAKSGFITIGNMYCKVGIPHIKMICSLD